MRAQGTIWQWQFDDELLQANMWLLDGELIEGSIVPPEIKTFIILFSLFWKKFPAPYFATFRNILYQLYVLFIYILSILCFIYGAICEILVGPLSGLGGNWPPITSRQHIDNISEYFQFNIFPPNTFINISQWLPRYQKREDQ